MHILLADSLPLCDIRLSVNHPRCWIRETLLVADGVQQLKHELIGARGVLGDMKHLPSEGRDHEPICNAMVCMDDEIMSTLFILSPEQPERISLVLSAMRNDRVVDVCDRVTFHSLQKKALLFLAAVRTSLLFVD